MANQNIPYAGFYFKLTFNGEEYGFQEVSGISLQMETNEIVEGGENRFAHWVPTIGSKNLVLKRGIVSQNSALLAWCQETLEGRSLLNPIKTHHVMVTLLDANGTRGIGWEFYDAYPVKWSVGLLQSEANEIAIETLELAFTYFERTTTTNNNE